MKKIISVTLIAAAFAMAGAGCGKSASSSSSSDSTSVEKTEAPKYASQDGKFKINFPGEPTVTDEKVPTDIGEITMKMFMYEKSRSEAYMVAYSDYPEALIKESDPMELLQGSKEGVVSNISATISEEKEISIDGHKGVYFKAAGPEFSTIYKLFLVNNRLFQIGILKADAYPGDAETKSFIDSFELTK